MKTFRNTILLFSAMLISGLMISCGSAEKEQKAQHARQELRALAASIDHDFKKIADEVLQLAISVGSLYVEENIALRLKDVDRTKYRLADNGVFYKPVDDGNAAVFVSGQVPVNEAIKEIVYFTEPIDVKLKEIVQGYPEVVQVYYNDKNSYNRIYPFFDVLTQYEPKMDIPSFNFYYLADAAHNPEKKAVWVNQPYVDPAGRGWMVSVIAPVYVNGQVEGVPGIDVTINALTERYIKTQADNLMILDPGGVVVTTQEYLVNLFSLPPLKDHKYFETIKSDTYLVDRYNLLKSKDKEIRQMAEQIIQKKMGEVVLQRGKEKFLVLAEPISELGWTMVEVIPY